MAKIIFQDIKEGNSKEEIKEKAIWEYFDENPWKATVDLNYIMSACNYITEALKLINEYDFDGIEKKEENPASQCHADAIDKINLAVINLNRAIMRSKPGNG